MKPISRKFPASSIASVSEEKREKILALVAQRQKDIEFIEKRREESLAKREFKFYKPTDQEDLNVKRRVFQDPDVTESVKVSLEKDLERLNTLLSQIKAGTLSLRNTKYSFFEIESLVEQCQQLSEEKQSWFNSTLGEMVEGDKFDTEPMAFILDIYGKAISSVKKDISKIKRAIKRDQETDKEIECKSFTTLYKYGFSKFSMCRRGEFKDNPEIGDQVYAISRIFFSEDGDIMNTEVFGSPKLVDECCKENIEDYLDENKQYETSLEAKKLCSIPSKRTNAITTLISK